MASLNLMVHLLALVAFISTLFLWFIERRKNFFLRYIMLGKSEQLFLVSTPKNFLGQFAQALGVDAAIIAIPKKSPWNEFRRINLEPWRYLVSRARISTIKLDATSCVIALRVKSSGGIEANLEKTLGESFGKIVKFVVQIE